jgi:hypothetical protein
MRKRKIESIPLNTIEQALRLEQALSHDLAKKETDSYRKYRIFSALTADKLEALAAFFIWKARGETIEEFINL